MKSLRAVDALASRMDMERRPQYDEMLSKFGAQGKVKPPSREGIAAVESFELGFLRDPMHALVAAQNDKDEMVRRRQAVKAAARAAEIPMHIVEGRQTQGEEETAELPPAQTPDPPAGNGAAHGRSLHAWAGRVVRIRYAVRLRSARGHAERCRADRRCLPGLGSGLANVGWRKPST